MKKATVTFLGVVLSAVLLFGFVVEVDAGNPVRVGRIIRGIPPRIGGIMPWFRARPNMGVIKRTKYGWTRPTPPYRTYRDSLPSRYDLLPPYVLIVPPFDDEEAKDQEREDLPSDLPQWLEPEEWEGKLVESDFSLGGFRVCDRHQVCELWIPSDGGWIRRALPSPKRQIVIDAIRLEKRRHLDICDIVPPGSPSAFRFACKDGMQDSP